MASHERDKEYVYDEFSEENNIIMSPTESAFGVSSSGSSSVFSTPSSDFSSPFGSEIGSTETESEDDDFISELSQLTRRMAEYTFQDDKDEFPKSFRDVVSGNSEASGFTKTSVKANSESGFVPNLISSEICSGQVLTDEQMRSVQVYQLKNQPQLKQQQQQQKQGFGHGGKRVKGTENVKKKETQQQNKGGGKAWKNRMVITPPSPRPPPPVSSGSGMRAVFLKGSNSRNGCSGTGVFLPSTTYGAAEPKRKPGGSTVLIPARVLQTLQQHFSNAGAQSPQSSLTSCCGGGDGSTTAFPPWQNDVLARINGLLSQQKEHAEFQTRPAPLTATNHDIIDEVVVKLPQEWTY